MEEKNDTNPAPEEQNITEEVFEESGNTAPTEDVPVLEEKVESIPEKDVTSLGSSNDGAIAVDKPKNNSVLVVGLVCMTLVAIAGVCFGVWAMMDYNSQKEQLNSKINTLTRQKTDLENEVSLLQAKIDGYEGTDSDTHEILPPEWNEAKAVVEEGKFTILNADGEVYMQDDENIINDVISCDSGTASAPSPLICIVSTPDGEAKYVYDYDEKSLQFTMMANE